MISNCRRSRMQSLRNDAARSEPETVPRRYKLDKILDGDIQEIIDACIAADQAKKLAKMQDEN